jgi:xanthine dehydrogenase iron-sulfur cluster and FAD-binding subunit A
LHARHDHGRPPIPRSGVHPDEDAIRAAISGNLCRCTGYADIVRSIQWAARAMRGEVVPAEDDEDPTWKPSSGPLGH